MLHHYQRFYEIMCVNTLIRKIFRKFRHCSEYNSAVFKLTQLLAKYFTDNRSNAESEK